MHPAAFACSIVTPTPSTVANFYRTYFNLETTADLGWFISLRRPGSDWEICLWDERHESVPNIKSGAPAGIVLAFTVDDAATLAERFTADGITLLTGVFDEAWGQRHFFVADPAGTPIDVVQFTAPDPAWLAANGMPATL